MNIKSFFQSQVSNDEYVDRKKLQFRLEALYIIIALLSINILIGLITGNYSGHVLLSMCIVFFFTAYTFLRSIFAGVEYPDVASKNTYKTKRREVLMYAVSAGIIFFVLSIGQKLFFNSNKTWTDIIGVGIIFLILYAILNYLSVRKSYKKNKDIFDDE